VATSQGLRDDTLREILALSEKWEQRAQVYRKAPELVGEPERALALLDRLRQGNHDGNDLYFLDLAIADVRSRWPDYTESAEALRRRLYSHIPAPDEALFQRAETALDGQVPLWREIATARCLIGSLEGESRWEDERPRHEVTFLNPFCLTATPVTNAQYRAFDRAVMLGDDNRPVTGVTWFAAVAFCRWLEKSFTWARGARLPTEEEWEFACRSGAETRYWSGDRERDLARIGWYLHNSGSRTHRVGEKPANPWGLYDMHGNVWEWTLGSTISYKGREAGLTLDPQAVKTETSELESDGPKRVLTGGSAWLGARFARAATRDSRSPAWHYGDLGFRVLIPSAPIHANI
jgi:formylglycine-generating enzyme required for sulfatase activity